MSLRVQALMRTRCPECGTIFRVTSEQLRLKAGKVRCGHCQRVFNAFDEFLADGVVPAEHEPAGIEQKTDVSPQPALPEPGFEEQSAEGSSLPAETDNTASESLEALPEKTAAEVLHVETDAEVFPEPEVEPASLPPSEDAAEKTPETTEESTLAAREAGLVAAREFSDTPGYNRWAAGTLANNGLGGFGNEPVRHAVWPFVVVAVLLFLTLSVQLLYHFRSGVVQRLPDAAKLYELAAVDIPLPQNVDLVAIDASDLQSDNARGLFVLQATLHNRANYAQAWPALELTLTDISDTVVSRRVMMAADYLPPAISPEAFPANGEVAVRLWIEARDIGAAGYRLYIFYP
ncbi:MAG: DUF3426 domain-containing protein [Azonexus sp.]|nr:DUF3426 domain-containing protein [Azonexus sp.]